MLRVPHLVPALAAALVIAVGAAPGTLAQTTDTETPRTVTVTASGSVSAVPDMATISTGVQSSAATAREALSRNSRTMRRVIDRLKEAGIRARDIATDNLSVQPEYKRTRNNEQPPEVVGYRVNNSVRIRVRDIALLGEILDEVVQLGANQVGGISFEVRRAERLRDDARTKAMENAQRRARLFARAADADIGRVLMIREGSAGYNPRPRVAEMRTMAADSVPIAPGSQQLSATVTVTWELRR